MAVISVIDIKNRENTKQWFVLNSFIFISILKQEFISIFTKFN
jgi:hypothetical protein